MELFWLASHGKRAKGQARIRRYHSIMGHLVTFRIIAEEFQNTKTNIFCCFVDFRKDFDIVPRKNLWNMLEEIKVPLELRVVAIRMSENVISKFKNIVGCPKEINCNIIVKQGCTLSPTLFGIYIDKLEDCLCYHMKLSRVAVVVQIFYLHKKQPQAQGTTLKVVHCGLNASNSHVQFPMANIPGVVQINDSRVFSMSKLHGV
jgi:hypothetical protein